MAEAAALVLFSAGQDSTTCLAWALSRYDRVETVGFDYGQRHRVELTQRPRLLTAFGAAFPEWGAKLGPDHVVDMGGFGALAKSALTADVPITTAPMAGAQGVMPSTFVPARNLVFLAYAGALAWQRRIGILVGGMCETDYSGYPDCREATLQTMAEALRLGLDAPLTVETPLMHLTKGETWGMARDLGGAPLVDLIREETHTCYEGDRATRHAWGYGCGHCPACDLRAKGWEDFVSAAA